MAGVCSNPVFRSNPPGNYLAHSLRMIHDDSDAVFPESSVLTDYSKFRRWGSTYKGDYIDIHALKRSYDQEKKEKQKQKTKDTQQRTDNSKNAQMFSQWKVPERLTSCSHRNGEDRGQSRRLYSRGPSPIQAPSLYRSKTSLPIINGASPREISRTAHPLSRSGEPRVAAAEVAKRTRPVKTMELLDPFYQPLDGEAKDFDQAAMQQAIRLMAKEGNKNVLDRNIQKWLMSASGKDRAVAMEFLQSLMSSQMANLGPEARECLRRIAEVLKQNKKMSTDTQQRSKSLYGVHHQEKDEGRNLRHIRLLTPHTRGNKWMHQTWHHLPPYGDKDRVENKSGIMTEPTKIAKQTFVIHPEWG